MIKTPVDRPQIPASEISFLAAWRKASQESRIRRLGLFCFILLLVAIFGKSLVVFVGFAANSELHSYIVLVPLVSAYLFYIRRHELSGRFNASFEWALFPLLIGIASIIIRWRIPNLSQNDYFSLTMLALVCLVTAGCFLFLGRAWMWAAAFPFSFLVFLIPMPETMSSGLETASKFASAEVANLLFNITNTPVFRNGPVFQLQNITIEVAQECSGIRSSWILLITSLLASNLFLKTTWRRAILVCFVVPLAIVRNGFRIFVIASLCIHFGPQMIHSIIHRRGGPLFFLLSLIPFFVLLEWLRRRESLSKEAPAKTGGSR
jgi:exosortase C (VPDSG-CTERM-specific)